LAGKKGIDCCRIGQFDICKKRTLRAAVLEMDSLRMSYRRLKARIKRLKKEAPLLVAVKKILPH